MTAIAANGYIVEQITEGSETASGPANGIHFDLETLNLSQYDVIVFGSNNAVYDAAAVDAIDAYIFGGGSALFISDANLRCRLVRCADSDQQFLDRFGIPEVHQDQGTYVVGDSAGEIRFPTHPIFAGVNQFDGEGVSPIVVDAPAAGVAVTVLANAEGQTRVNEPPFGSNHQGGTRPVTSNDAALVVAHVGSGRIAGHFDRNTFFNLNGAGTEPQPERQPPVRPDLFRWLVARRWRLQRGSALQL